MTYLEHFLLPVLTIACGGLVSQYKTRFNLNKGMWWNLKVEVEGAIMSHVSRQERRGVLDWYGCKLLSNFVKSDFM